ncbi:STAS-like domain-containing protein [Pontibacter vulgaris]|uniref:STAS-like domain-containing protein n=1 Tax=Pontibacter vulgaris TaxID=2905679 RepID=UPI001FA75FBE|nr:STAS-like domain-containing protein [Pontibacter vulgaris]
MKTINLNRYSPIISDKIAGDEIYSTIINELSRNDAVSIDLDGIKSMATFCAKQIFGKLYLELGPNTFFQKIALRNASNDVKTIIKIGIQNALEDA